MTTRAEFLAELTALVTEIQKDISDEYRATDDPFDDTPAIAITIGADDKGWSYQTGDNSYTGGAYAFAYWGVGSVTRDDKPSDVAEFLLDDLESQAEESGIFFYERKSNE